MEQAFILKRMTFREQIPHWKQAILLLVLFSGIGQAVFANRLWSSGFELNSLAAGDEWKTKTGSPAVSTAIVRSGAYSLEVDASGPKAVGHQWNYSNDAGPVFFRFYLRVERFPSGGTNSTIASLENTSGTDKIRLRLNSSNQLNLYNNEDSVQIGNSSEALDANQWYRIELAYRSTQAGATFNANAQAALDGNVFADANATLNTVPAEIKLGCTTNCDVKAFFDDVAINDSNGTSQTGFPGTGRIIHLRPNATGDSTQWNLGQPDNSNHFADVNEIVPDDATSYIEDTNAGLNHIDEFQLDNADIPADSNVLLAAVGYRARVQNTSNNRYKLRLKSQSNGTVLESDTIIPQNSGNYRTNNGNDINNTMNYLLTATTKPDSGNPWTASDLNNSQIGIQNIGATAHWLRVTTMWLLVEYAEATPNQSPDINLLAVDGFPDNEGLPSFSFARDQNLSIDFNVQDLDSNNLQLDLNFSASNIQGTGQAIVQQLDLNQLETNGPFRCDQTDFRSSTRCTIDWNIASVLDGNYFLLIQISDRNSTDFDSSDNNFLVDNTPPSVSITSPLEGAIISSQTVALQFDGNDSSTSIARYWVSSDGVFWIDNNQNESYSFTSQSTGSHTYWVRAADSADNNSADANVTVTVSVSSGEQQQGSGYPSCSYYSGSDTCTADENCSGSWLNAYDSTRCCSTACQTATEETETILESALEPFGATPLFVLDKNVSQLASESLRLALTRELAFSRKLTSQPIVRPDGSQAFKNTIMLTVQNTSSGSLENVQVMENIPKSVIQQVSEITQETVFETVQADPVIRFSLGSLSFGEEKTVSYSIAKTEAITPQQFSSFEAPVGIVQLLPSELCSNVQCRDENPCTEDVCVAGTCRYVKLKNGTVCGAQQQCQNGQCVSNSSITGLATTTTGGEEQKKPAEQAQSLFNSVVLGALIIALLAGFWLGRKRLKKG